MKGAEKNITRSGRTVRAAVEERLPATQDDVKAIHTSLRRIEQRLDALEASGRPAKAGAGAGKRAKAKPAKAKSRAKAAKAKPKR